VRSKYLKEGGDLFSLTRLIVDPVMVGRLSPEGTGLEDEVAMLLLDRVFVEGKLTGGAGGWDIYVRLALQIRGVFPLRFHLCKFLPGPAKFLPT
jgi:hypothetical protein